MHHEIETQEFVRAKGVKKLVSKDLIFSLYENCIFNSINDPITKEQVIFRIIKHVIYSTNNRIALGKLNDKKKSR